jgi:hypothetical protein
MKNVKHIISSLTGDSALFGFVESIDGGKFVVKTFGYTVLLVAVVTIISRFISLFIN